MISFLQILVPEMCTHNVQLFTFKVPAPPPHDWLQGKLRNLKNASHDKPQKNILQRGHNKLQYLKAGKKLW